MNNVPTVGDARQELLRAMRSCHPDWMSAGRVTFSGGFSSDPWKNDLFLPILRPHLETCWGLCARQDTRGWQAADRALDTALPLNLAERSRNAGVLLATSYRPPAAEKNWVRLVKEIAEGRQPGHLASVMALRAATFSLSPRLAVGCYLLVEARGGWGAEAENQTWDLVTDCLSAVSASSLPAIRVA